MVDARRNGKTNTYAYASLRHLMFNELEIVQKLSFAYVIYHLPVQLVPGDGGVVVYMLVWIFVHADNTRCSL